QHLWQPYVSLSAQVISTRVPPKGSAPRSENPRRKTWLEQKYLIQPSSCEPYVKRQKETIRPALRDACFRLKSGRHAAGPPMTQISLNVLVAPSSCELSRLRRPSGSGTWRMAGAIPPALPAVGWFIWPVPVARVRRRCIQASREGVQPRSAKQQLP